MQSDLCFCLDDALREATRALGGAKSVGHELRPELDADAAGRWWLDCMNPDRAQKPSLEQVLLVMRLAREEGCHAVMNFIARDVGYSEPEPITPEDEQAELQRAFLVGVKSLESMAAKIMRSQGGRRG